MLKKQAKPQPIFKRYLILLVSVVLSTLLISCDSNAAASTPIFPSQVCINEHCFTVEIAATPSERAQGLKNIESMDADTGMLFIFDLEDHYSFWMQDTPLSLDILWINSLKQIVHIEENTTPFSETSLKSIAAALYVLEINAGLVESLKFEIGDRVLFE